uniref:Uncharacterized protein n=1 Tax=Ditylenchus dipsaci TaxID=166011 RepID=A0A915DFH4_9BILA
MFNSSLPHWVGLRHNVSANGEFGAANRFTLAFLDKTALPEFSPYNHYWASYTNSTTGQLIQEPNGLEIEHYKEACVMLCDQTVQ